jgi:hypothetical protein
MKTKRERRKNRNKIIENEHKNRIRTIIAVDGETKEANEVKVNWKKE